MSGELDYKPMTKLAAVHFDRSVMFTSEMESASIWKPGSSGAAPSNSVDDIFPALVGPNGDISLASDKTSRPTDGIVLRKRIHDLNTGRRIIKQTFVPWANIRSISYGE